MRRALNAVSVAAVFAALVATGTSAAAQPSGTWSGRIVPHDRSYTVPTILWASHDVILGGGFYSARAFTTARQASFFQAIGLTFDATKAQVFVHVDGPQRAVSLAATHDAPQTIVASNWAAGDSGHEVFFPNVDATGGTTLLIVNGGAIGAGSIPLVAGTITNVSLLVH